MQPMDRYTTYNRRASGHSQQIKAAHSQSKGKTNVRNSFYAYKFKNAQARPTTHQISLAGEIDAHNEIHQFFANARPATSKISNNFMGSKTEAFYHKKSSPNTPIPSPDKMLGKRAIDLSDKKMRNKDIEFDNIVNDMNDYFSIMKQHKSTNLKKNNPFNGCKNEGRVKSAIKTYMNNNNFHMAKQEQNYYRFVANSDNHLNVRGLKPALVEQRSRKKNSGNKLTTEEMIPAFPSNPRTIIKYRSNFVSGASSGLKMHSNSPQKHQISGKNVSPTKSYVKNRNFIDYFGVIKELMSPDQVYRSKNVSNLVKVLYYRDFIWKIWFNSGWKVKIDGYSSSGAMITNSNNSFYCSNGNNSPNITHRSIPQFKDNPSLLSVGNNIAQTPKFFVGRGNNSKLIKRIMSKRWWWKLDAKQQNANFLWTQLKIYSAYQNQEEYPQVQEFQYFQEEQHDNADHIVKKESLLQADQDEKKTQFEEQSQENGIEKIVDRPIEVEIKSKEKISDQGDTRQIKTMRQKNECNRKMNKMGDWWDKKLQNMDKNTHILTYYKYKKWKQYIKDINNQKKELKSGEQLQNRRRVLQKNMKVFTNYPQKVTNHLHLSRLIGNKKALFKTMMTYYQLTDRSSGFLPLTYHITSGLEDPYFLKFLTEYYRKSKQQNNTTWIVKPGEMSNRGSGITVCKDLHEIKSIIKNKKCHTNGKPFSYIIQEYIKKPLLYQGRKFDIRHYIMISSTLGRIQGYFYQDGYIRTTSYKYTNKNNNPYVHLTNDAVQKHCKEYGKYEKGNKVSYDQFDKYLKLLQTTTPKKGRQGNQHEAPINFYEDIHPKIRQICIDVIRASYPIIDPKRKGNNFQIFGLDIMIDENYRPWLIEVNTNPCLELSSPILAKMIPKMLDNAFSITIDPLFPPPQDMISSNKRINLPLNYVSDNRFQLVLDEKIEGRRLNKIYEGVKDLSQMEGYGSDEQAYESADDDYDAEY